MSESIYIKRAVALVAVLVLVLSCGFTCASAVSGSDTASNSDLSGNDRTAQDAAPLLLVVMTTALEEGRTMSFSINSGGYVFVDWGNGAAVPTTAEPGQLTQISGKVQGGKIKIYSTAAITNLVVTRMALTSIDAKAASLDVCANRLTFETLPPVSSFYGGYFYSPQSTVALPESVVCGKTIDLSDCSKAYDQSGFAHYTEYRWFTSSGEQVNPSVEINGRFAFGDEFSGQTLRCEMRNELFPDLVLRTNYINILEHDPLAAHPQNTAEQKPPAQTPQEEQRNTTSTILALAIAGNLAVMVILSAVDSAKKKRANTKIQ